MFFQFETNLFVPASKNDCYCGHPSDEQLLSPSFSSNPNLRGLWLEYQRPMRILHPPLILPAPRFRPVLAQAHLARYRWSRNHFDVFWNCLNTRNRDCAFWTL